MQVIVDSLLINYKEEGTGKVVVLLHGWGDRLETFADLQKDLAHDYKVISLDLPGFGQSQAPHQAWDLDNYAQILEQFLLKIEAGHLYAVIGHSNGGALAIRATALKLIRPEKLVLLAASGVRDKQNFRRRLIMVIAKIGKVATFWLPKSLRRRLQMSLYGTVGSDMMVTPSLKETFKRTVRQDIQADAACLSLPVLLVYGDKDRATPLSSVGKRLHSLIKDSRLEILPGADHFVHHAESLTVAKLIRNFFVS